MEVSSWLRGLGLESYTQAFHANDIDAEVLPRLTADDLSALGITSIGHRAQAPRRHRRARPGKGRNCRGADRRGRAAS